MKEYHVTFYDIQKAFMGLALYISVINHFDPLGLDTLMPFPMDTIRHYFVYVLASLVYLFFGWLLISLIEVPINFIIKKIRKGAPPLPLA